MEIGHCAREVIGSSEVLEPTSGSQGSQRGSETSDPAARLLALPSRHNLNPCLVCLLVVVVVVVVIVKQALRHLEQVRETKRSNHVACSRLGLSLVNRRPALRWHRGERRLGQGPRSAKGPGASDAAVRCR